MQIIPYSDENLANCLSNVLTSNEVVEDKTHYWYLTEYLGPNGLGAKTIVIEPEYVSKDFLHDFASYYSLCFTPYEKICKRVHFFNKAITEEEFKIQILHNDNTTGFWNSYLGFVVVKPIAQTVVGYTVLKTYGGDRYFWGTRKYKVHVFGCEVPTFESLAFQEQDSVLAACATTAIWSMLNKAAADFHTILKTPSEITRDADNMRFDGTRLFPNTGLNISQICQAIEKSGLVTENKQPSFPFTDIYNQPDKCIPNQYLKKIINAYAPIGIPIILVIKVPQDDYYGLHAVAVSGHCIEPIADKVIKPSITYRSDDIVKLYAHDDQYGPFARITFWNDDLVTEWTEDHHSRHPTILKNIIISLYPKIRITYSDVSNLVIGFDGILATHFAGAYEADWVWDIKIQFSEDFKCQIRSSSIANDIKLNLLTTSMPKYIWVACCYVGEAKIIDLIFDATNVNNAMILMKVVNYLDAEDTDELLQYLHYTIPLIQVSDFIRHGLAIDYFNKLVDSLRTE